MGRNRVFTEDDLRDPKAKGWKKPLGEALAGCFDGLAADPVGSWNPDRPHPIVALVPAGVLPILQLGGESRRIQYCMTAKLLAALCNGGPSGVFDVLDRAPAGHTRMAAGFWVERPWLERPPDALPDEPDYRYDIDWDWHRFEQVVETGHARAWIRDWLGEDARRFAVVSRFQDDPRANTRFHHRDGAWWSVPTEVRDESVVVGEPSSTDADAIFAALAESASYRDRWVSFWLMEPRDVPIERTDMTDCFAAALERLRPLFSWVVKEGGAPEA